MRYLSLALVSVAILLLAQRSTAQDEGEPRKFASEYRHDFRGQPFPDWLMLAGDPASEFTTLEKQGFRITLPRERGSFNAVAVRTRFGIEGDFELTTAFEILHADEPEAGAWGVGLTMRIEKANSPEAATIARLVRGMGNQIVFWDRSLLKDGGQLKFDGRPHPCKDTMMRLRLSRTGAKLNYQWAPGVSGGAFETFKALDNFGVDELKAVGISATTGKKPARLDLRLIEFQARSGGVAAAAPPLLAPLPKATPLDIAANPTAPPSRYRLVIVLVVGLSATLLAAIALGGWFYLRQRRGATQPAKVKEARK